MQQTLLVWIPASFTLLFTLPLFFQARRNSKRYEALPIEFLLLLKIALCSLLAGINLFILVHNAVQSSHPSAYLYPTLLISSYSSMTLGHYVRQRCGLVTSGIQHISALMFLVAGGPEFYQRIRQGTDSDSNGNYLSFSVNIAYFTYYAVLILYTFVLCFADSRRKDVKKMDSTELDSSFLNRLTFWWFNSLLWRGYRKALEIDDLFELNEGMTTSFLTSLWEKYWTPRLRRYIEERNGATEEERKKIEPPSIAKTLLEMHKWEILYGGCLKFFSDTLQFANPLLLHLMINFISTPDGSLWEGLSYAVLFFVFSECRSLMLTHYMHVMFRMGTKFQTALTAAIYKKTLNLSNTARREKTVGEIVNLMSIDVENFFLFSPQIHQFWACLYQIGLALLYLFLTLGTVAPAIVIMIVFIALNITTSIVVKGWQTRQMELKDERSKMVNEVLNGMKVVKLYAYETPMEQHIEDIRKKELGLIRKASMAKVIVDSFNIISPFVIALVSFSTYVLSDSSHQLTPQIAFVSLTLFNQIKYPMAVIAFLIHQLVQVHVSNRRIKSFLIADELDMSILDMPSRPEIDMELDELDASWEDDDGKRSLSNISVTVPKGDLLAVVGKVGSGKSSLLSSLLGEMGKLRGRIGVSGRLAYVPQQSWIQNASVRENILFGRPYNRMLYKKALHSCALLPDLDMLPHGDQTEVGEKGINLSGGQKARLSLARAVYQDLDVYLLDDPLSAVDAHVGKHIYENVIGSNGMLKDKTRILVTHGLTYTKQADEIVVLSEGKIVERGRYSELVQKKGPFYQFLQEYKTKGSEEDLDTSSEKSSEKGLDDEEEAPFEPSEKDLMTQLSTGTVDEAAQKLIRQENIETGGVKMTVYQRYMKAASYWRSLAFLFFLSAYLSLQIARNFWLSQWSDLYVDNSTDPNDINVGFELGVYAAIGVVESSCIIISLIFLVFAGLQASHSLHAPLIHSVMRSPMEFFDTTPMGRILNRCGKDVEVLDTQLPENFRQLIVSLMQAIFNLIAIVLATPLFAVVIIPVAITYYLILRFYIPTARQFRRLESVSRSPIYSHFGESIQGAASLRAYDRVDEFKATSGRLVDRCIRTKYLKIVSNRWVAVRLELVGNFVIFFSALFAVLAKELGWADNAGTVGVSISYALTTTDMMNAAVRLVSMVESNIVSVERIEEYIETKNEADWDIPATKPSSDWPEEGLVQLGKYSTRYREGLDLVLKDITATVSPGEKIGIVGRTGADKSSFALALFRLIEPAEGSILIDGIDISRIGLHDLRSALTIIPQDPVLFSGTVRFNLDPFEKCTDGEIWQALELAHLKDLTSSFEKGLCHQISEGGENVSVGQRQLVCLARALLRKTKILVLDEATAAVDVATDALIQATIRQQFADCTIFTIAHRLNTILDYDRILVLDQGRIAQFDAPSRLLENRESLFSRMVADSNTGESS